MNNDVSLKLYTLITYHATIVPVVRQSYMHTRDLNKDNKNEVSSSE